MNKNLPLSLVIIMMAFGLSACAPKSLNGDLSCDVDSNATVKVTYGITGIFTKKTIFRVKEKVAVKKDKGLIFVLKPRGGNTPSVADFKDAVVKIKGKSKDSANDWFYLIQGSYNSTKDDGHKLGICADADAGDYEYEIEVVGFGNLDPRVIVKPS
jgi:hypothetical protein